MKNKILVIAIVAVVCLAFLVRSRSVNENYVPVRVLDLAFCLELNSMFYDNGNLNNKLKKMTYLNIVVLSEYLINDVKDKNMNPTESHVHTKSLRAASKALEAAGSNFDKDFPDLKFKRLKIIENYSNK